MAAAIDQARQHVAAELVGAERVAHGADMAKAADHRALIGVGEPEPRRAQGGKKDQRQDAGAGDADLVAQEASADGCPIAAGFGGGRGMFGERGENQAQ